MVDSQAVVAEDTVTIPVSMAGELRDAVAILQENGLHTDEFPFLPNWECALRFVVLRTFADSEILPSIAIENTEKYIDYILNGVAAAKPSPLPIGRRKLAAV